MGLFGPPNFKKLRYKKNVKKLVKILLLSKNYENRLEAARILGEIRDPLAVEPLCSVLKSPGNRIRIASAEALGEIGDRNSVPPLIRCLESDLEDLRAASAEALGKIGEQDALPGLTKLAYSKIAKERDTSIIAIGKLKSADALSTLKRIYSELSGDERLAVIKALGEMPAELSESYLKVIYIESTPELREAAAKILSGFGLRPDKTFADKWEDASLQSAEVTIPIKIKELIDSKANLPAIPEIISRLNSMLSSPDSSIGEVGSLIKTEPVLSARVVQVANSSFFRTSAIDIADSETAAKMLGFFQLKNILYAFSFLKQFDSMKKIDRRKFWSHSLVTAQFSKELMRLIGGDEKQQEHAYTAGLMHDIGILVFAYISPLVYDNFLKNNILKRNNGIFEDFLKAEQSVFNCTHSEVGAAYIDRWWPVEKTIVKAVLEHHANLNDAKIGILSKCVGLANEYCHSAGIDNGVDFIIEPKEFDKSRLTLLSMNQEQIEAFFNSVQNQIEVAELILGF